MPSTGARTDAVLRALGRCVSPITAQSVLTVALQRLGMSAQTLERDGVTSVLVDQLEQGLTTFCRDSLARQDAVNQLHATARGERNAHSTSHEVTIVDEDSVVEARVHARTLASALGFDATDVIKIVTAVSELARNVLRYAGSGTITLRALPPPRPGVEVKAVDHGPGIPHIRSVLDGTYRSKTGMGLGLRGCQRLMDQFAIDTAAGCGTTVTACKLR